MTDAPLAKRKCVPCEGGVPTVPRDEARTLLEQLDGWSLSDDGKLIARKWSMKNFVDALNLINQIGKLAESEQHHPDLHLTGYRNVRVELTTHAIGGLSENDFIVAAKINGLDVP